MSIKILLFLTMCLLAIHSQTVCNNCLNSTCGFNCIGQQCQAYSFNQTCQPQGCYATFYPTYTTTTMNVTTCVACNYTFPGCVLCNTNSCTQCEVDYYLAGIGCYNRNGTPVGAVPYMEGVAIAFVVLFGVFGAVLLVIQVLRFKRGDKWFEKQIVKY